MSITREQIRELAEFDDPNSCAVSFYFDPATPRNKAHKEDAILIKDLAREALRCLEEKTEKTGGQTKDRKAKREGARADIDRIVRLSDELRSNGTHAKAVFACSAQDLWREYDLPRSFPGTQLFVDHHFHLKPLAHLLGAFPKLGIVLVDRHRARFFEFRLGELSEREGLFQPLSRKGRSDGYAGYDGGRAQRRVDDEARQHFKNVAEVLKESLEKGVFEKWILGCQDVHCSQLEPQLHPYVSQAQLGRFPADMAHITRDEIRTRSQEIVESWQSDRRRELLGQLLNEARSHRRGVTGLRRVLRSLEMGEVQTLIIGETFQSHAVECAGCGHLDAHIVSFCPVCGRATQEIVDVGEAMLPWVIRRDIETLYIKNDPEFDRVGNIGALLRFRAGNVQSIFPAVSDRLSKEGAFYPGRLRRFASR
jgi:peptide chain release factor subunit 1